MAKILVIGGTGYAGAAIVKEAAQRGHQVVSISRKPPARPVEGVQYLTGGMTYAGPLIEQVDVVVMAMSPRGENAGRLSAIYTELAQLAESAGKRFIVIGGFSSTRPAPGAPRIAEGDDLNPMFADEAREMNSILEHLLAWQSPLDWLFVSPAATFGAYAPGERQGKYRVGADISLFDENGQSLLGGEDFGLAVVDEIEQQTHSRTQVHYAY